MDIFFIHDEQKLIDYCKTYPTHAKIIPVDIFTSSKFSFTRDKKKFNKEKSHFMLQVKKNTILDMKLHSIISASIKKCNLRTFEAQKKAN